MNFDVLFCINRITKNENFDFAKSTWNISGNRDDKSIKVSRANTDSHFELQSQLFNSSYNTAYLKDEFYNFDNNNLINFDNIYKVLSTISFDWDYKLLLFTLLKMTKINFINSVNEIRKLKGGQEICLKLQRLLDYYNNSDLNVAESSES